ncbi:hypothetical protein L6164_026260 [Bauhinia variegata]|uniref:Uncharacterized protein n=1 Tax=Bauhinia variegata TaxID=167791 RepID=A0ACB9LQF1_BAUVA|nr:hypothetical protein L6164_026260 [Bauhinia variegata]
MIDLIEQLEKLGCSLGKELAQDLILQSLTDTFSPFIVNFNMNKMDCDLHEMLNLLIDYENQVASSEKVKVSGSVNLVGNYSKGKGKGKKKPKKNPHAPKGVLNKPKGKEKKVDQKDAECFFYKKKGHWKRNCPEYLATLKDKKQADSITEAEYIAACDAAKEAVWMKKFLTELGVVPSIKEAVPLLCDNTRAIAQAKEPRSHQKSKHVLRKFHLIREIIECEDVQIQKVEGKENAVDPFTKALGSKEFDKHKWKIGLKFMTDWL